VFEGVDAGFDGRRATDPVLGVDGDATADGVDLRDHGAEHVDRHRVVGRHPVRDQLDPAGPGGLLGGDSGQLVAVGAASPPVEELAVLGDPRSGVDGTRDVRVAAEPVRRVSGEAW
jgi:hypothetical protein